MNIPRLLTESQRFMEALEDLGFNGDDRVSGADTVDVIARYLPLLNQLPALAKLAMHAELLVKARGRFHTEQNYKALATALDDLKGV